MKERILKFINKEGISPANFADEIGVQRSSVSHILSGRNNPSYDFIFKILDRFKSLNAEWLITGAGEMYKKAEKNLIIIPDNKLKEPQASQTDLFADMNSVKPKETKEKETEAPVYEKMSVVKSSDKLVEKIIVFYSDKSFTEFLPS